jgi:hypothetical protein
MSNSEYTEMVLLPSISFHCLFIVVIKVSAQSGCDKRSLLKPNTDLIGYFIHL